MFHTWKVAQPMRSLDDRCIAVYRPRSFALFPAQDVFILSQFICYSSAGQTQDRFSQYPTLKFIASVIFSSCTVMPSPYGIYGEWMLVLYEFSSRELYEFLYPTVFVCLCVSSLSQWLSGRRRAVAQVSRTLGSSVEFSLDSWTCVRVSVWYCPM
jgi:hypothetical protein